MTFLGTDFFLQFMPPQDFPDATFHHELDDAPCKIKDKTYPQDNDDNSKDPSNR